MQGGRPGACPSLSFRLAAAAVVVCFRRCGGGGAASAGETSGGAGDAFTDFPLAAFGDDV